MAKAPSVRDGDVEGARLAERVAVGVLVLELLFLALSGAALFFVYRPSAQAFGGVGGSTDAWVTVLRSAHRIVSTATVLTAIAALVVFAMTTAAAGRRVVRSAIGGALVAVVVAASFTGYLLPWDQLALWAVSVGDDLLGYRPMFDDRVRFVLIGGTEVGPDTVLRWLGVHALVLSPLAVLLVGSLWRQRTRARGGVEVV